MQAVLRMQGAQNGLAGSSAQNGLDTDAGSSANCSVVGFNGFPLLMQAVLRMLWNVGAQPFQCPTVFGALKSSTCSHISALQSSVP